MKGDKGAIGLFGDGYDGFASQIAAENQHIGAIEFGAIDEFIKADIRAVKIGGKEQLHFTVRVLVFLAKEHSSAPPSKFCEIVIDFPLGDRIVIAPPFRLFKRYVGLEQILAHHPAAEIILFEGCDRFEQGAR